MAKVIIEIDADDATFLLSRIRNAAHTAEVSIGALTIIPSYESRYQSVIDKTRENIAKYGRIAAALDTKLEQPLNAESLQLMQDVGDYLSSTRQVG